MRERFNRFMQGRYGYDDFARFTAAVGLVLLVLSMFSRGRGGSFLNTLGLIAIVYTYYRVLSRDIHRRYSENRKFLDKTAGLRRTIRREINIMKQRKDYHIYTCPGCAQKIRIPRGKGHIEIRCPKCGQTFVKNS